MSYKNRYIRRGYDIRKEESKGFAGLLFFTAVSPVSLLSFRYDEC
jgi:hypothetical protein